MVTQDSRRIFFDFQYTSTSWFISWNESMKYIFLHSNNKLFKLQTSKAIDVKVVKPKNKKEGDFLRN